MTEQPSDTYTIDHDGIDGRWRVYWLRPDGHGAERLFDTQEQAEAWVKFMESVEEPTNTQ